MTNSFKLSLLTIGMLLVPAQSFGMAAFASKWATLATNRYEAQQMREAAQKETEARYAAAQTKQEEAIAHRLAIAAINAHTKKAAIKAEEDRLEAVRAQNEYHVRENARNEYNSIYISDIVATGLVIISEANIAIKAFLRKDSDDIKITLVIGLLWTAYNELIKIKIRNERIQNIGLDLTGKDARELDLTPEKIATCRICNTVLQNTFGKAFVSYRDCPSREPKQS